MPNDIRIYLSFRHHRKRKRLQKKIGADGVLALIDLWCSAAEQFPSGHLKNYGPDDIEIDAGWNGKNGEFVAAILDEKINFLEKKEDGFYLKNWKKRQPWVSNSEIRSNISRFNVLKKKHKDIHKELQALGVKSISREEYDCLSNPEATLKQCLGNFKQHRGIAKATAQKNEAQCPSPSPSPSPSPVPLQKRIPERTKKKQAKKTSKKVDPDRGSGIFKPRKNEVKNKDFSANLSELFLNINSTCEKILKLPRESKKKAMFDPRKWAQKQIGLEKHPGAILKSLQGLSLYWDTTGDPWAYCLSNLEKFNGNFNEQENIAMHEELKKQTAPRQLESLTCGLLQAI